MPRGGHSGGRGKKSHKGQRRHFTDADDLAQQAKEDQRKREMRRKQGLASDEEEETDEAAKPPKAEGDNSGSSSESESESDEDSSKKGVSHLIAIENPNRIRKSTKKVTALSEEDGAQGLSRREREEIEKQQAKVRYQQLHAQGKTEEAISDMARLALIRRQREETAKKREDERKVKEAAAKKGKS